MSSHSVGLFTADIWKQVALFSSGVSVSRDSEAAWTEPGAETGVAKWSSAILGFISYTCGLPAVMYVNVSWDTRYQNHVSPVWAVK